MATLCTLSALAALASLAVATRLYPESRTERLLAAMVVFVAVLELSMQALGWTDSLSATSLALVVSATSLTLLAGSLLPDPRTKLDALGKALVESLGLPGAALGALREARSPVLLVGLVVTAGVLAWTTWLAYLAPSGSWDGVWYHETMAYLAIQTGSFRTPELPAGLSLVEGFPRAAENLMIWATIFSGRALVDAVGLLTFPMAFLGTFVLARQHLRSIPTALGVAIAVVTIPGSILELRSTYIDLTVFAAFVAAAHFSTRPRFSSRDAWMAGLSIGFLAATKANQIFFGGALGVVALVALVRAALRARSLVPLGHGLGALVLCVASFAPSYVQNYAEHENPIWPLRYRSERLGVDLPGPIDIQDQQLPLPALLHELFDVPSQGQDYHDTRKHAYGYGLTYIGLPALLLALGVISNRLVRAMARGEPATRSAMVRLLVLFGIGMLTFLTSPALYWARFSLGGVAIGVALVAWLLDQRWRGLSAEGPLSAIVFANLLTLAWAQPAWEVPLDEALDLATMDPGERVFADTSGCLFSGEMRRMREERIGPGDVVVFDDDLAFPANLWNEALSNRVVHVPFRSRESYLERLDEIGAEWVAMYEHRDEYRALAARPETWREIGRAHFEIRVFERVPASEASAERAPEAVDAGVTAELDAGLAAPEAEPGEAETGEAEPGEATAP